MNMFRSVSSELIKPDRKKSTLSPSTPLHSKFQDSVVLLGCGEAGKTIYCRNITNLLGIQQKLRDYDFSNMFVNNIFEFFYSFLEYILQKSLSKELGKVIKHLTQSLG